MGSLSNIYLSLPVKLKNREAIVKEICDKLDNYCNTKGDNVEVKHYIPGQVYNSNVVSKCDVFVFTDINMPWHITAGLLPSGVREELKSAMILRKPIYYIYRNKEGELNLYHCALIQNIQPIVGTTTHLYHFLQGLKEKREGCFNKTKEAPNVAIAKNPDAVVTIHKGFDRRLLL